MSRYGLLKQEVVGTSMTKNITRKMAVDCLLDRVFYAPMIAGPGGVHPVLMCGLCACPLSPGQNIQFDHVHADVHGGAHEYRNLRPVHAECHKIKTKADIQANAKIKRILADKPSKRPMKSRGFDKTRTRKFGGQVVPRGA